MQNIPELRHLSSGENLACGPMLRFFMIAPILIKNQADNPDS
jgi:hypothetical protein